MSAPHVTGVVALMFEADPDLSASDIRSHLILSARKDQWTGDEVWNKDRGYGKVNALEAVRLITSVSNQELGKSPHGFSLLQNYPNPFNGSTSIEFTIPEHVDSANKIFMLAIYDLRGRMVRQLARGNPEPGKHHLSWNGQDNQGGIVASGVYIYRLIVGETVLSMKLICLQ